MLELGQIIRSFISSSYFILWPTVLAKCQLKCYLNTHCHKLWFTHSLMCNVAFFNTPLRDKSTCSLALRLHPVKVEFEVAWEIGKLLGILANAQDLNQLRYRLLLVEVESTHLE